MIPDFSALSAPAWSQFWQVSVLILVVGLATRLFCRKRPHLAYVLWLLVVVKCLTPPVWSSPTGVFSWAIARQPATVTIDASPVDAMIDNTAVQSDQGDAILSDGNTDVAPGSISHAESPAVVAPVVTPPRRLDLATMVGLLWLSGAASYAGILVVMRMAWSWRLRRSSVSVEPDWTSLLDTLCRRLGIRRKVRLIVTTQPVGPAVFGLLRPTLVLPETILSKDTTKKLKAVLAHELIHVRRGDTFVGLLQVLTQALWWFHPLVWWANRELIRQRECCCDEEVLAGLKCNPAEYAQSLIDLLRLKRSLRPSIAFPGIRPVEVTSKRLESIMDSTRQFRRHTPRWYWLVLAMGVLAFVPGAGLTLGDPPSPSDRAVASKSTVAKPTVVKSSTGEAKTKFIRPLDLLDISVTNTFIDQPINGTYLVDITGHVSLGPAYGRIDAKGLQSEEAKAAVERKLVQLLRDPKASVTRAGHVTRWHRAVLPKSPYSIKPGDVVHIHVPNTLIDHPINNRHVVKPSGKVNMGEVYGQVQINGMGLEDAQAAIKKHLQKILRRPEVAVTLADWKTESTKLPTSPYRIAPGDLLQINCCNTLVDGPIDGTYLIEPSGKVCLGPWYGRIQLKGMGVQKAEAAVKKHLLKILRQPEVAVTMDGWRKQTPPIKVPPHSARDMQNYLSETLDLVRQGQNEKALERFLWFHDNAPTRTGSTYGVRLGKGLRYWRHLGNVYPPALAALTKTRNDKTARMEIGKGNVDLFCDIAALNRTLGEDSKTVELFRKLDQKHEELATQCWNAVKIIKMQLLDAKAYDLAGKYIVDFAGEFRRVKETHDINATRYGKANYYDERYKTRNETRFVKDTVDLIHVAIAAGDTETAKEIQKQALAVVDDQGLRDAVAKSGRQDTPSKK